jgi:hypothetical protein
VSCEMAGQEPKTAPSSIAGRDRWRYRARIRALGKQMSRVALVTRVMWKAGNRVVGTACTMGPFYRERVSDLDEIQAS